MINDHKQTHTVPNTVTQGTDFEFKQENLLATAKDIVVKNKISLTDKEFNNQVGFKFFRRGFSTLVSGSVYSVIATDFLIGVTHLSYAPTIGLPRPKIVGAGKHYIVKDEAGGALTTTITVQSAGEETIDGAATSTIIINYDSKEFYTDGANWFTK